MPGVAGVADASASAPPSGESPPPIGAMRCKSAAIANVLAGGEPVVQMVRGGAQGMECHLPSVASARHVAKRHCRGPGATTGRRWSIRASVKAGMRHLSTAAGLCAALKSPCQPTVGTTGAWILDSPLPEGASFDAHVQWLLDRLEGKTALQALVASGNTVEVYCSVFLEGSHGTIALNRETPARLGGTPLAVLVANYFLPADGPQEMRASTTSGDSGPFACSSMASRRR